MLLAVSITDKDIEAGIPTCEDCPISFTIELPLPEPEKST